jgi:hypothetical protein
MACKAALSKAHAEIEIANPAVTDKLQPDGQ